MSTSSATSGGTFEGNAPRRAPVGIPGRSGSRACRTELSLESLRGGGVEPGVGIRDESPASGAQLFERAVEDLGLQHRLAGELLARCSRKPRPADAHREPPGGVTAGQFGEAALQLRVAAAQARRRGVEDDAATQSGAAHARMGETAHHEAVAGNDRERLAFDVQPRIARVARDEALAADGSQSGPPLGGSGQKFDRSPLGGGRDVEPAECNVEAGGGLEGIGPCHDAPARHVGEVESLEVGGTACAGLDAFGRSAVALESAQTPARSTRQNGDGVADAEASAHERSRDYGTKAPCGKGAVHGEARRSGARGAWRCRPHRGK